MEKRTFLKISSVLLGGTVLSPMISCKQVEKQKNWAGNLEYSTNNFYYPKTTEEVQDFIKNNKKLRMLGTKHSFNTIADSKNNLLSFKNFDKVESLNKEAKTVTVGAGVRYGQLAEYLQANGFALHNLASLPHISVAGACATATHGSGVKSGNLATAVSGMEIVIASGEIIKLSKEKDAEQFNAAVVGLGAFGAVTKVTLNIQPTYEVRQDVYLNLPQQQLEKSFNEIMSAGYSVSLFYDWKTEMINQVWIKSRMDENLSFTPGSDFFGAKPATRNVHPIIELSAVNCTDQMGVPGPWHERLPHFKMNFTPSSGAELQTEYFIPRENAYEAIQAVYGLREHISPHLFITEIRTIAADDLWLSTAYKRDAVSIHFTWKQETEAVQKAMPLIEEKLAPFNVRPHWAKLFTISPSVLQSRYEKMADFKSMITKYDPDGKFRNEFIDKNIFG